ncbi:secreted protein [Patulibacter medicamentivorans]|uniref:Secreted protein n=1 Tax=Patulibacter medicamentivorans TaxID=1097667 RepID=H0EB34_9ACTN|nr:alpha/beta hydrolase [Patulibacter medicamentivorans]EHN09109.1 secreted protein [Patulibacter medicamentivorans]
MDDGTPRFVAASAPARTQRTGTLRRSPITTIDRRAARSAGRPGPALARVRRVALTLLLGLLGLVTLGPAAAAADDRGVPDPLAIGPQQVKKLEYDAGTLLLNLPTAGQTTTVPMKGSIVYPVGAEPSKVIIFLHGRHSVCIGTTGTPSAPGPSPGTCLDSTAPDGTPISTDVRSYGGYDYLSANLASHGYAVMSIEANITGFDNGYPDAGAGARSQVIQASLRLLDRWNNGRGPVTDDPDTTIGTKLVGKLELSSGIGLMGHSRGGDAVTDFVTYNRNGSRWPLAGVLALAPTYYSLNRTPEGTNYATLLPACDGDVSNLQGARFFENAKYAAGNANVAKTQFYVQGTDHNYFNTVWTGDDFSSTTDPACSRGAASSARLTPSDQRRVGVALMDGFLRRYVGGEKAFAPLMTGAVTLPSTAYPLESGVGGPQTVKTSYIGPESQRLDILRPTPMVDTSDTTAPPPAVDATATTVAATGAPIVATGLSTFQVCRTAAPPGRGLPATSGPYPDCPADTASATANRSIGTQFTVAWDGPASLAAGLDPAGAAKDVSGFGVLDLRAAVNRADPRNPKGDDVHPEAATQDLDVTLVDEAGRRASTNAARWSTALQPSIGTRFKHVVLNGIRIPLSAFAGVDLTRITSVELGFGVRTATGSIQLADVGFQETSATDVDPRVPPRNGPDSPEGTVVGTPEQQGTSTPPPAGPGTKPAACVDRWRPKSAVRRIRASRTRLLVVGIASDRGCTRGGKRVAGKAGGGVRRTLVAVGQPSGKGCRYLTAKGRMSGRLPCTQTIALNAKGTSGWSLSRSVRLAKGRYTVTVTTVDRSGNAVRAARQSVRVR